MLRKIRHLISDFDWFVVRNLYHIRSHKRMVKHYEKLNMTEDVDWHRSEIENLRCEIKETLKNMVHLRTSY